MEEQLKTFPKDVEGIYETALLKYEDPDRHDLKQFLLWLAFSTRPLNAKELTEVAAVKISSNGLPSYDPDLRYLVPSGVLATCSIFATEFEGTFQSGSRKSIG